MAAPVAIGLVDRAFDVEFVDATYTLHTHRHTIDTGLPEPLRSLSVVAQELPLARGAIVTRAEVTVAASPAGATFISDVARVRAEGAEPNGPSTTHVVDLLGVRTVAGVSVRGLTGVGWWAGDVLRSIDRVDGAFTEVRTDRLRLTLSSAQEPAVVGAGTILFVSPPADLRLLVNDEQVWFHAGSVRPNQPDGVTFSATVDVTAAVAAAAGGGPVTLTLTSAVPGRLELTGAVERLLVEDLRFPEGEQRPLSFSAEGVASLDLPVDPIAGAQVALVRVSLRGATTGPTRVIPPVGPEPSNEAFVVLDPERGVLVELPAGRLSSLSALEGIRLPLIAGSSGAEIRGILRRAGERGEPGEALPDGQLGPAKVAPGPLGPLPPPPPAASLPRPVGPPPNWVTLSLARPHALEPGAVRWVELFASRGSAAWPLAGPPGEPPRPEFEAIVRRTTADGGHRPLSQLRDVATAAGVLRLVGSAPPDRPIPILDVGVPGAVQPVVRSLASLRETVTVELVLPAPLPAFDADRLPLALSFTAFAPIDLVVGPISVGYL
jgi:hypothetical protein